MPAPSRSRATAVVSSASGTATLAQSTRPGSDRWSAQRRRRRAPRRPPARGRRRCRRPPTSSTSGCAAYFSAWKRPRCPTPTTAARRRALTSHLPARRPRRRRCRPRSASASISGAVEHDRATRLDRQGASAHLRDGRGSSPDRRPGRSKRRSWVGLQTFTTTMSPFTSWPARRMVASVPSMPSTATTALPRTTTLCPMSNCPITFAARNPKWMSAHSSGVGGRADEHALRAGRSPADTGSTRRSRMPSLSSSCGERPEEHVVAQRAARARGPRAPGRRA